MSKVFTIEEVSCPINEREEIKDYRSTGGQFLLEGADKNDVKDILAAVVENKPVLLKGPTGCGKTALIRYLASQTNNGYLRMQLTGATTVDEFLGRWLLNEKGTDWQDGMLVTAMKLGLWLVLDELNMALPEIHAILHPVMDDDKRVYLQGKNNEVIHPHPDFRIFSTINPSDDYVGTKEMNKAFWDRFTRKFVIKYPEFNKEVKIIQKHSGLDKNLGAKDGKESFVERIVKFGNVMRAHEANGEINYTCSTRQLINLASALTYMGIKDAARVTILNNIEDETEYALARDEFNALFLNKENISLTKMNKSAVEVYNAEKVENSEPINSIPVEEEVINSSTVL